ncbi:hypothetical protein [Brachyspira pilosicoli]|uniref:hypothetical protein n=1 Tax=Brachyspira pilosicoli TaxID=52584 RepID=UPI0012F518A1|nr:hypothetical protein [Brachyspira pilosicoli]
MNNSLGKKIFNYNKTYNKKNNFENRLTQIETIVGINNNGTPNGNGIINMLECFNRDVNENKENLKDIQKDINNIKFKLGELEYILKEHQNTRNFIEKEISSTKTDIKEIKSALQDSITTKSIVKIKNIIIGLGAVIVALSTIIGSIVFFANKLG